jgi:GAF domain-containing protein
VALLCDDAEEMEIVADMGYDEQRVLPFRRFSVDRAVPMADAVRDRMPIFLESPEAWNTYYPGVDVHVATGGRAAAAVPLMLGARVLGALGLTFAADREFDQADREYILTLARQCAVALERAQLYEESLEAQTQAEEARERLEFILDVSTALAEADGYRAALQLLAQRVVPALADGCVIDVVDHTGAIQRMTVVFAGGDDPTAAEEALNAYSPLPGSADPTAHVLATGRPAWGRVDDQLLSDRARDADHFNVLKKLGLTSYICVPLTGGDQTFSALTLLSCSERFMYDEDDVAVAEELARHASSVIESARQVDGA